MPEMEYAGREAAVLAVDARAQQADQEIGILKAPPDIVAVEAVHAIQIRAPDREVARSCAPPILWTDFAYRSEPRLQQGRKPIDVATKARAARFHEGPELRFERLAQDPVGQPLRHQHAVADDKPA